MSLELKVPLIESSLSSDMSHQTTPFFMDASPPCPTLDTLIRDTRNQLPQLFNDELQQQQQQQQQDEMYMVDDGELSTTGGDDNTLMSPPSMMTPFPITPALNGTPSGMMTTTMMSGTIGAIGGNGVGGGGGAGSTSELLASGGIGGNSGTGSVAGTPSLMQQSIYGSGGEIVDDGVGGGGA